MSRKFDVSSMEEHNKVLLKKISIYLIGLGKSFFSV
jgi:hypothetical protein